MHWPDNPIARLLQRQSTLAGPFDRIYFTAPVEPVGGMVLRVVWPMDDPCPDPDLAREMGLGITKIEAWVRPADTTDVLPPVDVATADRWMYETAWALGAGYLYRWMHAPRIQPWQDEAAIPDAALVALHHEWGLPTHVLLGNRDTEGPGLPEMVLEGARHGYWAWECNVGYRAAEWHPYVKGGWRAEWEDAGDVHEPDGSRTGHPPDRSKWPPDWLADIASEYERLGDPEAAALGIACDLVHQCYKARL